MAQLIKPQIKWTDEKKKYLIENYPYGNTKEISEYIGCTRKALKTQARLLGVRSLKDKNKYKLQKLTEDNTFNYYWWGFILADGHISKKGQLGLISSEKDSEHLIPLANFLDVKIKKRFVKTHYGEGWYYNLTCQDAKYGFVLKEKLGITENKTYECINFDWIDSPEIFIPLFMGFFDGDGCIGRGKNGKADSLKIECHYNWKCFMDFCSSKLKEYLNIESTSYITSKGSSALRIFKMKNFEKLKNKANDLKLPLLERKWIF